MHDPLSGTRKIERDLEASSRLPDTQIDGSASGRARNTVISSILEYRMRCKATGYWSFSPQKVKRASYKTRYDAKCPDQSWSKFSQSPPRAVVYLRILAFCIHHECIQDGRGDCLVPCATEFVHVVEWTRRFISSQRQHLRRSRSDSRLH